VIVDGSASTGCGSSPMQYRWLDGATVVCDWSASPVCDVLPPVTTTYQLEVACLDAPTCVAVRDVTVEVLPTPSAELRSLDPICVGEPTTLDAAASDPRGCPVPLEYRFLDGATEIRPWGTGSTHGPLTPATSTIYTVEVRCSATPGCSELAQVSIDVVPLPTADAGADASVCEMQPITLDGSTSTDPGCPGGLLYEWRDGATVVRPADPDPTWSPPTALAGTTTYTLVVSCAGPPGCEASDAVTVEVRVCSLAVTFDLYRAVAQRDGTVLVTWKTLEEDGTLGFIIERALSSDGPFVAAGDHEARGPGFRYELRDTDVAKGAHAWYRIVELTSRGRGDATPAFRPARTDEGGASRIRGSATSGRKRQR